MHIIVVCRQNPGIDGVPLMSEYDWLESGYGKQYNIKLIETYSIIDELTEAYNAIFQSMDAPLENAIKSLETNIMTMYLVEKL